MKRTRADGRDARPCPPRGPPVGDTSSPSAPNASTLSLPPHPAPGADAGAAAIAEQSVREEEERRRHAEELKALEWRQAVADNVAANEKAEEWRRIRAEQAKKYVDLCSSGEED